VSAFDMADVRLSLRNRLPIARRIRVYSFRMSRSLDTTDWRLLAELQRDGRLSYNELGRRVNLSSPAVADRVRRLEAEGVITGYRAEVDAAEAGLPISAFVQMRCSLGKCLLKTTDADEIPEIVEIHRLTGTSCVMLKVRTSSVAHFEGLVERLGQHGELNTHLVLSTPFEDRPVEPPREARPVTPSAGWDRRGRTPLKTPPPA
jgi:Lrp/AsnC family transcriptional regulator, leucine-responsive regulatory protein